ncbi:unnamed protein product [Ostreobium quekettii]|uniref:SREBP regulating gene protein n=1 Tax=Ostreobium quekettii TaxID=121088 RepID=A0A8S1JFY1_9CHLO|nr:unnamed protein product [Ostreobium quekettii]|eukprot:evm.model.scf_1240.1 EVM.evm.TU.scf_1240.1   scf_1240:2869-5717(-)
MASLSCRNVPLSECRNTRQGRYYITDDRGFLCHRDAYNTNTGCCTTGDPFSCDTCNLDTKCCSMYEACVSCCLAPKHNAIEIYPTVFRAVRHPETGHWGDEFEYCRGKCRTHSRSTVHENAFIDVKHFCFSEDARPQAPEPPTPPVPENVQVVIGSPGEDCVSTCGDQGLRCILEVFPALNSCRVMRDNFPCEAACTDDPEIPQPAYIVPEASKAESPAACFIRAQDSQFDGGSCDWSKSHARRLCPCGEDTPLDDSQQGMGLVAETQEIPRENDAEPGI